MANKNFEVQQLFKAYRSGVITEDFLSEQLDGLIDGKGNGAHNAVRNVFEIRGDGSKMVNKRLGKTAQSESLVFTVPPNFGADRENSHKGDQLIYVIEGSATCRVSGNECQIKAGDFVTIPAGAPHTLRTGAEKLFAITVFAPPEPAN